MTSSSVSVPSETRVPAIYGTIVTEIVLSIIFVALRLQARRLSFGYLRLDLSDWFSISALFFALAYFITIAVGPMFGFGKHIEAVTGVRGFSILAVLLNVFNPLALGSLKLSILALYQSIFPSSRFRRAVTALASLVVAWVVTTLILGLVECIPIESLLDNSVPFVHCLPMRDLQLVIILVHIGIEILILLLPIPPVVRLQASPEKKRLVILTFLVGGVDCVVSIVRITVWILRSESPDLSWQLVTNGLLTATEMTVGLLAVSFPVYRPLFKKLAHANDSDKQSVEAGNCSGARHDEFNRTHHEVTVSAVRDISTRHVGIIVTNEIELMRRSNIGGGWMKVPDEEEPKP
ncbi:hypothetical protein F4679DRAFT_588352 [Xylaria curta]|nr:hypothetical protein F4679DRAFT_588352 [Xylaria curta]